jgi:nucleoside-triphosphatase THEP1
MVIKLYNAMTFKDVRKYCQRLYSDLTLDLTGEEIDEDTAFKSGKNKLQEEDIALMIAKILRHKPSVTKIIVIDEIDAFEAHERGFLALTKAILESKTNTILIGIANSVDLPFKKKHSAIALRD